MSSQDAYFGIIVTGSWYAEKLALALAIPAIYSLDIMNPMTTGIW